MPLKKERKQWYNLTIHWGGEKGFHIFSKDISPKVNVIAILEFELTDFVALGQHFSHCSKSNQIQPIGKLSDTIFQSLWLSLFNPFAKLK